MPTKKIFILDDDSDLVGIITEFLKTEDYRVESAISPLEGLRKIKKTKPDLILLDIRMSGLSGLDVCRQLKTNVETKSIPIVMISVKSAVSDVVLGLEMGAEDYMRKPIVKEELLARVKAALRRISPSEKPERLVSGPLELDMLTYTATLKGKSLDLRPKELELLAHLLRHEKQLVKRAALSESVWKQQYLRSSRTIEDHIYRLRKKLGPAGHWIKSIKGVGYRLQRNGK